ncbi:hypothetical protein ACGFS9_11370 [Streptomyces sp. NPDC048566]|uniref:hypothetical protein n=1 Tax=Streptomyces sp. NPDC048566 TaxID=3365569 RepID=UPI0037249287
MLPPHGHGPSLGDVTPAPVQLLDPMAGLRRAAVSRAHEAISPFARHQRCGVHRAPDARTGSPTAALAVVFERGAAFARRRDRRHPAWHRGRSRQPIGHLVRRGLRLGAADTVGQNGTAGTG